MSVFVWLSPWKGCNDTVNSQYTYVLIDNSGPIAQFTDGTLKKLRLNFELNLNEEYAWLYSV